MIISPRDLRDMGLFKYYRLVRKWACRHYSISEPELELLMFLHAMKRFTAKDFRNGEYLMSWDKKRWAKMRQRGLIEVWREGDGARNRAWIYTTSRKCNQMITRIFKILLGQDDIPFGSKSAFYKNETYTDKVTNKVIDDMLKDEDR